MSCVIFSAMIILSHFIRSHGEFIVDSGISNIVSKNIYQSFSRLVEENSVFLYNATDFCS